jgi:hypothetical protein
MTRAFALAAVTIAALALAGCVPTDPVPTPTATEESASATPTPTPTPTPEPLVIASCDDLLPLAEAKSLFSESTEFLDERTFAELEGPFGFFELPAIQVATDAAIQGRVCYWGVPNSDGAFALLTAELTPADSTTLQAALTAAGATSTTMGTVTAYELEGETEISHIAATHLFTGDVWIASNGTSLSLTGAVAGSALDGMRTANPTLGL